LITKLIIKNYILIEKLSIDFNNGFSVITGETGAGKSIILGALNLISGSRIDHKIVGPKFKKCIVEGEFYIPKNFYNFFESNDIDYDENTIIRREILNNGKSRAFINDTPVKLELLKLLSNRLINIHNQNQINILSNNDLFYNLIDTYSNQLNEVSEYKDYLNQFLIINKKLNTLNQEKINFKNNFEYNKFIYDEIDKMNLVEDEKFKLEETFNSLKNFDKISNLFDEFRSLSNINDETFQERISKISNIIKRTGSYSKDFESFHKRFEKINIEIEDLFVSMNYYINNLSFDQNSFEKIQNRLYKINDLEKKHNVTSISELINKKNQLELLLNDSKGFNKKIQKLKDDLSYLNDKMLDISKKISNKRILSKSKIQSEIESVFKKLALKNSKIDLKITEENQFNKNGINNIDVFYTPNSKSEPNILSKIASGGEKSRILFAIKSILANKINLPTLVFDEIDSGMSGEIANTIGKMMKTIGSKIQIISISHLPQVASRADHHFKVFKSNINDNIVSNITELNGQDRINEIASMISGEKITESAINQASELLK
tara:strand:+ start:1809 stop:3458 length:1650 start_codon:yes stop_codon:yes gene_type:complete